MTNLCMAAGWLSTSVSEPLSILITLPLPVIFSTKPFRSSVTLPRMTSVCVRFTLLHRKYVPSVNTFSSVILTHSFEGSAAVSGVPLGVPFASEATSRVLSFWML